MSLAQDLLLVSGLPLSKAEVKLLENWYNRLPSKAREALVKALVRVVQKEYPEATLYRIVSLFTMELFDWAHPWVALRGNVIHIEPLNEKQWLLPERENLWTIRKIPKDILRINPKVKITYRKWIKAGKVWIPTPEENVVYPAEMLNVRLPKEIAEMLEQVKTPIPAKKFKALLV